MYRIERLDDFGRGITYVNNKICFVENALVDEEVEIEIIREKAKYLEAKVIKYITKSKDRIEVKCPYYDICGGCNLAHLNYNKENEFKLNKVKNIINKFSDLNIDINDIKYNNEYNYRNKIILHGDGTKLGLYSKNSHDIVPIDKCLLCSNKINDIIDKINSIGVLGIKEVLIRVSNDDKYSIVDIAGNIDISKYKDISDVLIYNNKLISKDSHIITNIGNKKYYLSSKSFFQINRFLTKDLYDLVSDNCDGNSILDLYSGIGSIGIYVGNNIIGVDNNSSNIMDAKENLKLNNVSGKYYLSNVEDIIDKFNNIDLVIVDPPRSGLDKVTIDNLIRINSNKIIYVSCDPITLARDIKLLNDVYEVKNITVFNLFPRTYHCESITILDKK